MNVPLSFILLDSNKTISATASQPLIHFDRYMLNISGSLKGADGNSFTAFSKEFYTALDTTPKFPILSDDDLLTLVQQQTFKYFWDFGHPCIGHGAGKKYFRRCGDNGWNRFRSDVNHRGYPKKFL